MSVQESLRLDLSYHSTQRLNKPVIVVITYDLEDSLPNKLDCQPSTRLCPAN